MGRTTSVTGKEKTFADEHILLSTTDLKGRITYANPDFCEIAEYHPDELINHGHNIVRHPDMPKAAFANLWDTINTGQSWMGPVKNRCKSGDHYWVNAYVTPIRDEKGQITEHQSVRTALNRDVVERAEKTYQNINAGKTPKALKRAKLDITLYIQYLTILVTLLPLVGALTEQVSWPFACLTTLAGIATASWFIFFRMRYKKLIKQAEEVFDNPLMSYLYSGSTDRLAHISLALSMRKAEQNAVIGRIRDLSQHVNNIAIETSDNSNDIASMLQEQHMEIEQVATAMNEMAITIQDLASSVTEAADAANLGNKLTAEGVHVVGNTVSAINKLASQLQDVDKVIRKLVDGSNAIETISDEISAIADQTNLLALNAAIEAARAGEQGRGFAVVAEEVRALAQRTQHSTEEIKNMLGSLKDESNQAINAMHQGIDLANNCVSLANDTGTALQQINQEVDRVSELNQQIATAVEEQSVVTEQVRKNTHKINGIATHGVEESHESKSLSDKLLNELSNMHRLIAQFRF